MIMTKNVHILSTDKPSRLYLGNNGNFVFGMMQTPIQSKNDDFTNQNIYITSDEQIKERHWYLFLLTNTIHKFKKLDCSQNHIKDSKKIILTTDQELIKDGVQAIDDEFSEWLVKNPSCEFIKVGIGFSNEDDITDISTDYELIIPKEETLEGFCNRELSNFTDKIRSKEFDLGFRTGTIIGLRFPRERSYSEEDVKIIINDIVEKHCIYSSPEIKNSAKLKWFEQFKKK